MKIRYKSKHLSRKSRTLGSNLGQAHNLLFKSIGNGNRETSADYLNRLKPDMCLQLYNAARATANAEKAWQESYGKECIVGVNGGRNVMNPVLHIKAQCCNLPFLIMHRHYLYNTWMMWDYLRLGQSGARVADVERVSHLATTMYPGSDQGFSSRAFWSMRPKFEGKISIINSIFELKDFKDVLKPSKALRDLRRVVTSKSLDRYSREFKRLSRSENIHASLQSHGVASYADLNPRALKSLARDSSGTAASALLAMNLAIKPTIADIMGILAQCAKAAVDHQNDFQLYGHEGTTSHFSERTSENTSTKGTATVIFTETGTALKTKRTATARFLYDYIPRSKTEALALYWGLTGSVEALWNMVPLGFVLDYIYTVGKALKYMDRDDNVTNLTADYCESVKLESYNGVMVRQDHDVRAFVLDGKYYPNSSNNLHLVSGASYTRYSRQPMPPYKGPALPKLKLPSKNQTANILALARLFLI